MNEKPSALEMRLGGSFLKTVDEWRRKQKDLWMRSHKSLSILQVEAEY
jgi:hypothetical protein